jgi:hypothetical protein
MEIELNKVYTSDWDNIQYPILELADGSYLCITYERSHGCLHINTYTKEEFVEQGFHKNDYDYNELFENLTREDIGL